ncbi:hypothetical protein SAMD00019534_099650 [Acytostelium subglobosum LB1]|uniref:hypothetical protein n=1 Tax=Acytostelium subglobosum LB1 TaxID=1410327 RepID=UPI000644985D|nr:hypothetical protein SAMD00019534_099650 [Acytostelium subglobosum LB1]GAM26790.1 hypothetical protein SAMD00019534_099650 [Acytostelium subglobosum LB1]|eukprot:XP_012750451.1 hypothetical protein SAMD00019534_099650 [Acytostelium subglobosum LB1]
MQLRYPNGTVISTITNANITYTFDDLLPGQYCIFGSKRGFKPSVPGQYSVYYSDGKYCTTVPPSIANAHFAMVGNETFRIGGYMFIDKNNDGVMDKKSLLYDVQLDLYSDGSIYISKKNTFATYTFDDLRAGEYCIVASYPNGSYIPGPFMNDNKFNNGKFCTTLPPNEDNANIGMIAAETLTIQGNVFNDVNNDGRLNMANLLNGATIDLQNQYGDSIHLLDNVTGSYSFTIPRGNYCIFGRYPNDTYIPINHFGDNVFDATGKYCFAIPPSNTAAHFGMKLAPRYQLAGIVWDDSQGQQGRIDTNNLLTYVRMELQYPNGSMVGLDNVVKGAYLFDDLKPGQYCIVGTKDGYLPGFFKNDNVFENGKYCTTLPPSNTAANFAMMKIPT